MHGIATITRRGFVGLEQGCVIGQTKGRWLIPDDVDSASLVGDDFQDFLSTLWAYATGRRQLVDAVSATRAASSSLLGLGTGKSGWRKPLLARATGDFCFCTRRHRTTMLDPATTSPPPSTLSLLLWLLLLMWGWTFVLRRPVGLAPRHCLCGDITEQVWYVLGHS